MNKETRSENVPWHGILAKNVGEAFDRFVNDEETRSKVAKKVAPELLKFIPGGGLAYGLVTGISPLLDDVNKSDDLSKYVKELHAKLDRLEREVRELKTLYAKQHDQKQKRSCSVISWWILLFAFPFLSGVFIPTFYGTPIRF